MLDFVIEDFEFVVKLYWTFYIIFLFELSEFFFYVWISLIFAIRIMIHIF